MKQIRLKDRIYLVTSCDRDCPMYNIRYYVCNLEPELYQERGIDIPKDCPLEDYVEANE